MPNPRPFANLPRRGVRFARAALLLALVAAPLAAQTADRLTDEPSVDARTFGSSPGRFAVYGARVVFRASSEDAGSEHWVTDGTSAGTFQLADACPGTCGGTIELTARLPGRVLRIFGDVKHVGAPDLRIWSSDGTIAGTIEFGLAGLALDRLISFDDAVVFAGDAYFVANDMELWRSDGTPAGTSLVRRVAVGIDGRSLVAGPDRLYFESANREIWESDGTAAGTRRRVAGRQASEDAETPLFALPGRLLFVTDTNEFREFKLWSSAGPDQAPVDLSQARGFLFEEGLGQDGGTLYFAARNSAHGTQLWRTDGTLAGTRRLTDIASGRQADSSRGPTVLRFEGILFFLFQTHGTQLWRLDEASSQVEPVELTCLDPDDHARPDTPPFFQVGNGFFTMAVVGFCNTAMVIDAAGRATDIRKLCPGGCDEARAAAVRVIDGELFFVGTKGGREGRLYRSDGTKAGTRAISPPQVNLRQTLNSGLGGVRFARGWILALEDPVHGKEPWFTDGTQAGTKLVADLERANNDFVAPTELAPLPATITFLRRAERGLPHRLFAAGNASGSASLVHEISSQLTPSGLSAAGSRLFFFTLGFEGPVTLWLSNGAPGGTRESRAFAVPPREPSLGAAELLGEFVELGGDMFFPVRFGAQRGLWVVPEGSTRARRFLDLAGPDPSVVVSLATDGVGLYFETVTANEVREFWFLDPAATTPVSLLVWNSPRRDGVGLTKAVRFGGETYVLLCESTVPELYRTDGTAAGTERVTPLSTRGFLGLSCEVAPPQLVAAGDRLYVGGTNYDDEQFVWQSDGTLAGTRRIAAGQGYEDETIELAPAAAGPVFTLTTEESGTELWTIGPGETSARLLADVRPGSGSSFPESFAPAGSQVYFAANDGKHGQELWRTDGTTAGTRLVHDLHPGAGSSHPRELTIAGDKLYFTADDGLTGRELWVLPLGGGPACRASQEALCLKGGRFKVEAQWRDFQDRGGKGLAVSLTPDTGYFWFFDEANVEAVVKVLDGRPNNGHFWTFYGALSNVEYFLTVTDVETGLTRRYFNPSRNFASVGDTRSFGPLGASLAWSPEALAAGVSDPPPAIESTVAAGGTACAPSATRLCLQGGRFAIDATWRDFRGREGVGTAVSVSGDTGYFWFFDEANVETMVKVLDGRTNNGNFWVFYGALSNVDYDLTVTDTTTGQQKTYQNRNRAFASVGDTRAFAGS